MSLPKAYNPAEHEAEIYKLWEDSGAFKPAGDPQKLPFSIILPPPNANGNLHTGHAMYTVEDIMIRYHRMRQQPTLWLPGTDHAGIETQVVYERELAKEGKSRFDFSREDFFRMTWDFTQENKTNMLNQLRQLGYSLDWSRLKFTMDEDIVVIVYETFKQLHDDGLIYRGNRIVNWCPRCRSGFADIEVKHEDRDGVMYTLDYGPVQIATTRPETIFADSAVAVNPDDKRYTKLVGQDAVIPLIERPVRIIADEHVDPKTGTGALKVTPAHDPNDYEIGLRHNLTQIQVVDLDGKMINVPEELLGLSTHEARQKAAELLDQAGKLVKTQPVRHAVSIHGRCGTVIEPLITEQWWLKVKPLTEPATKALETGEVKIVPARFTKQAISWLQNLHDWNISRQDWWGIRVPVYYKDSNDPSKDPYLITADESEAKAYYGDGNYRAETDIFDTWFSSSQWPFATLQTTGDFDQFYPTSVLDTGRDILFLWVTRMIMLGLYRTGQVPFHHVYLHGMVNDEQGKKMSKSKGNVINPLDLTAKYGTDALRLALTLGISPGNDGPLSDAKVEGYRNFCNKLWNVARFIIDRVGDYSPAPPQAKTLSDKWIMGRVDLAIKSVNHDIERFDFSAAGQVIYGLLWSDLADWYIEASKVQPNPGVLVHALETILKLLHPFAPFVTETVWQNLPWQKQNLITESWPEPIQSPVDTNFDKIQAVITEVRGLVKDLGIRNPVLMTHETLLLGNADVIKALSSASVEAGQGSGLALAGTKLAVWLKAEAEQVAQRLEQLKQERDRLRARGERASGLLKTPGFTQSAPASAKKLQESIVDETSTLISKLDEQITQIEKS